MTCPSGTCNTAGTDCATCSTGQTSCPTGCRDLTRDPLNCGQCGMVCPMPAGGTGIAVCSNSQCGISCNPGYLACERGVPICQQTLWDFEDMTLGGFRVLTDPSAVEKLGISGQVAHTGKYTFGIQINATGGIGAETRYYRVGQSLCNGDSYVRSKYVTVWMMIQPEDERQTFGPKSFFGLHIYTDRDDFIATGEPRGPNEWFPVSVLVDGNLTAISFDGYFEPTGAAFPQPWRGFVWIDDIVIE
jgi:hypothetical protein